MPYNFCTLCVWAATFVKRCFITIKVILWKSDKTISITSIFMAKMFRIILNGKTLLYSGLSWNFRGNTETRTIASDLIWPSIESSLTRREKKKYIRHVLRAGGFLQIGSFYVILVPSSDKLDKLATHTTAHQQRS